MKGESQAITRQRTAREKRSDETFSQTKLRALVLHILVSIIYNQFHNKVKFCNIYSQAHTKVN